jgi:uncharacterized membrane protein YfcA
VADLSAGSLVLICLAALAAGWIDAVVGGGGAIQLPALLIGLPQSTTVAVIAGTNKLSSVAGTAAASATYLRRVKLDLTVVLPLLATAAVGAAVGAKLVGSLPRAAFTPLVAVAVAGLGLYTWRRPRLGQDGPSDQPLRARSSLIVRALELGALAGVWDGLIGPGAGVLSLIGLAAWLGHSFLEAAALARLTNLTTNLVALAVLGWQGQVLWRLGALMALANLVGGTTGALMALRHGHRLIRRVFFVSVVLVEARLLYDLVRTAL